MGPTSVLARLTRTMGTNLVHNLGCLPPDRLDWKPAPSAKSALEIVNHLAYFMTGLTGVLRTGTWSEPQFQPATDQANAQQLGSALVENYAAALDAFPAERAGDTAELPFGSFPMGMAMSMPVCDLIHHHGQIAYIQCLLGDTEDHFSPEIMQA